MRQRLQDRQTDKQGGSEEESPWLDQHTSMCAADMCSASQLMMRANDHHNLKDTRKQHLKIYQRRMRRKGIFSAEDDEAPVLILQPPGSPLPDTFHLDHRIFDKIDAV